MEKDLLDHNNADVQPDLVFNHHKCAMNRKLSLEDVWVSMVGSQVSLDIPLCPQHYS